MRLSKRLVARLWCCGISQHSAIMVGECLHKQIWQLALFTVCLDHTLQFQVCYVFLHTTDVALCVELWTCVLISCRLPCIVCIHPACIGWSETDKQPLHNFTTLVSCSFMWCECNIDDPKEVQEVRCERKNIHVYLFRHFLFKFRCLFVDLMLL